MHFDPFIFKLVVISFSILLVGTIFRVFNQPYIIAYLITGIALGQEVFGIVDNQDLLRTVSEMGVVFLLFFIGMEIQPRNLIANWKVAVIGILLQITLSLSLALLIGHFLSWPLSRCILMGFIISISSTAVLLNLLKEWGELDTKIGQSVLVILLTQDMAIIPMIIITNFLGTGTTPDAIEITKQVLGASFLLGILLWISKSKNVRLPFAKIISHDKEIQVFASMVLCFGLAIITALMGLSTALGGFIAGMVIGATKETEWVHNSLEPFRNLFVALFFTSIGMVVNLEFVFNYFHIVIAFTLVILIGNTLVNTMILKILRRNWKESFYFGVLLSQIGEFSFILAAVGFESNIVTQYVYQMTIAIIILTLLLSPVWIGFSKRALKIG